MISLTYPVDIRLHGTSTHIQPPRLNSSSERGILAPTSARRHWIYHLWLLVYGGNAEEVVYPCSKSAGLAHWSMEPDRSKSFPFSLGSSSINLPKPPRCN